MGSVRQTAMSIENECIEVSMLQSRNVVVKIITMIYVDVNKFRIRPLDYYVC